MKSIISDEELKRLADGSLGSTYRIAIDRAVSAHFRNIRFLTSRLVADCVLLNTLLNDKITEKSADEIIRYTARRNRAFYTSVESIYKSIDSEFIEYARSVLVDFDTELCSHIVRFVIYVLSVDCSRNNTAKRDDLFKKIYDYDELSKGLPHY